MAQAGRIHYTGSVHLVLAAPDSRDALQRELSGSFPGKSRELRTGLFSFDLELEATTRIPYLAFARQIALDAREVSAASIRTWAGVVVESVAGVLPDHQPWSLHVYPFEELLGATRMGARAWHSRARAGQAVLPAGAERPTAGAGHTRCRLVREAASELLTKRRRHLGRYLRQHEGVFGGEEALAQLILTSADQGFLSIAPAPLPFQQRHAVSCFPGGEVAGASDKEAPSRAFAKLVEAEARLGRRIGARDTCVDLGAAPGSWTYVAARRGARVTAVDRSDLRADLMQHRSVQFQRGDAFRYEPAQPVDWLLCDVIAAADRSADLLLHWLRSRWCRHFIVTLKLDDSGSSAVLWELKRQLPELTSELWLLRLSSNKKEVCAFGTIL